MVCKRQGTVFKLYKEYNIGINLDEVHIHNPCKFPIIYVLVRPEDMPFLSLSFSTYPSKIRNALCLTCFELDIVIFNANLGPRIPDSGDGVRDLLKFKELGAFTVVNESPSRSFLY